MILKSYIFPLKSILNSYIFPLKWWVNPGGQRLGSPSDVFFQTGVAEGRCFSYEGLWVVKAWESLVKKLFLGGCLDST